MYILLRKLGLINPFSLEYLLGKLNKKIACIIIKFSKMVQDRLKITL